jgi:lambda repressor-like predicted transcriptional regulator
MSVKITDSVEIPHGTHNGYQNYKCRCRPCTTAYSRYQKGLKYDLQRGRRRTVDGTQARVHAERLVARGWTHTQIAAAAGVNRRTVTDLFTRPGNLHWNTVAKILAVHLDQDPPVPRVYLDATGTRRRLQALSWLGYTWPAISGETGLSEAVLVRIADCERDTVHRKTADAVATAYRKLLAQPTPDGTDVKNTRRRARRRGWHGPAAWDRIDDPWCQPEEEPVRTLPGAQAVDIDLDRVRALAERGMSDAEIGQELRVSGRTILRRRKEHGIPAALAPGVTKASAA